MNGSGVERVWDRLVLCVAETWVALTATKHLLSLRVRMWKLGVRRVSVALPRRGDEKFLWRKLFDHDPRFVTLSDKVACKEWVRAQGFDVAMPETLWVGKDAADIPDGLWDRPAYLKAAHGYQMNIPVLTRPADRDAVIAEANGFVARDHGVDTAQWAYSDVPRRLLLEEAVFTDCAMMEVKYYTNGPIVEQFVISKQGTPTRGARWLRKLEGGYERDHLPTTHGPEILTDPLPPVVTEGLKLASEIGEHFDQMRVDTMTDGHKMYLGELTVYNQAGRFHQYGHQLDAPTNRSWDLRRSWFLNSEQPWPWSIYAAALRRSLDSWEE